MHNYCACPWCQGPKPNHPPKAEKSSRAEYDKMIAEFIQRINEEDRKYVMTRELKCSA